MTATTDYGDLLVGIERVAARVPDGIMTEDEKALAREMIAEASEEVRVYGRPWTSLDVPASVAIIVAKAAARGYMNPAGYIKEDADSVGLERGREYAKGASLTPDEIRRVKVVSSRSGFGHIQASKPTRWQATSAKAEGSTYYVPVDGNPGARWFPYGSVQDGRVS